MRRCRSSAPSGAGVNAEEVRRRFPDFDTSDVDRWIGVPLGGGVMKEPVSATDIRRWAQGMQNPNPLHYDEGYAAESRFGRLVAPQSFVVCTSDSHGAGPAIQGTIPGTHMLFGGDEWWFFGPRIEPGDRLNLERMLFDYKVTETKFAGPTMFSRGDTTYINQRGELVAKQRSTSIRYLAEEARPAQRASPRPRPEVDGGRDPRRRAREVRVLPDVPRPGARPPSDREGGREAAAPADRPAHDPELHHRVARVPDDRVGHLRAGRRAVVALPGRLAPGDVARPRGREDRPDARRRPLLRAVARPRAGGVRAADRHAARLRLRRFDGRVDARHARELGGRVGRGRAQPHVVPLARAHRRRHLPRRRGDARRLERSERPADRPRRAHHDEPEGRDHGERERRGAHADRAASVADRA